MLNFPVFDLQTETRLPLIQAYTTPNGLYFAVDFHGFVSFE